VQTPARLLRATQLPEITQCRPSLVSSTVSLGLPPFLRSLVLCFTYSLAILIWRSFVLSELAEAQRWCGCSAPGDTPPSSRAVHCPRRFRSCFAADSQYVPVLAFADMRLTLRSPGAGESGARARLASRISSQDALQSVATSLWQIIRALLKLLSGDAPTGCAFTQTMAPSPKIRGMPATIGGSRWKHLQGRLMKRLKIPVIAAHVSGVRARLRRYAECAHRPRQIRPRWSCPPD
jgi:hypothetical protein